MELDSVRVLKAILRESVVASLWQRTAAQKRFGVQAGPTTRLPAASPAIALGIAHTLGGKRDQFKLAVPVRNGVLENSPQVDVISKQAKGEVDVPYIGLVSKRASPPWHGKGTAR